jgi:hypothetical protein
MPSIDGTIFSQKSTLELRKRLAHISRNTKIKVLHFSAKHAQILKNRDCKFNILKDSFGFCVSFEQNIQNTARIFCPKLFFGI